MHVVEVEKFLVSKQSQYFEARHSGYKWFAYYLIWYGLMAIFGFFMAVYFADGKAVRKLVDVEPCNTLNAFLHTTASFYILEAIACFLSAASVVYVGRGAGCSYLSLGSLAALAIIGVIKLILFSVVGVVITRDPVVTCVDAVPGLYDDSVTFLIGCAIWLAFQATAGIKIMFCCGAEDCVHDGMHQIKTNNDNVDDSEPEADTEDDGPPYGDSLRQ
jgi:hypothetical protein